MDGALIGDVDQYSLFNICPQEHILYWECLAAGQHTLTGTVRCKRAESRNYWICLRPDLSGWNSTALSAFVFNREIARTIALQSSEPGSGVGLLQLQEVWS